MEVLQQVSTDTETKLSISRYVLSTLESIHHAGILRGRDTHLQNILIGGSEVTSIGAKSSLSLQSFC